VLAHAHLLQEAERGRQLTNLNLALTQAKAEAEAGSKAKSQFLAVVSHEIRYAHPPLLGAC
jgi:signal transduction histidine kinase